jgi:sugar lactone lactonase YvrE
VPAASPVVETVIPAARLPNGMAWSRDGRTMFWIDSFLNTVDAFDFDGGAGTLRNRRTVVRCPRQGASVHGAVGGARA